MQQHKIALHDISPQGVEITIQDQSVWEQPIAEFGMDCRITTPLEAVFTLLPVEGGCLVRGRLTGDVVVPCDRCAEDTPVSIAHEIETFAPLPVQGAALAPEDEEQEAMTAEDAHVVWENGVPMLDTASLCWEELMLALPMRPLCTPECKGLCAQCGANLNHGACQCAQETGDPRLAALRNFKVHKRNSSE